MVDPFEFLRRDLERISRALGPDLLPATFRISDRTFVLGYTSLKESPGAPGQHTAEVDLVEVGKGGAGSVSLGLTPASMEARIEYATVADRRIGIGRAMVQAVERDLASRGYRRVSLHAMPDSIPFWRRLGYRDVGKPDAEGALEMTKRI